MSDSITVTHSRDGVTIDGKRTEPGYSWFDPLRVLPGDVVTIGTDRFHFDDPATVSGTSFDGKRWVPLVYGPDPRPGPSVWLETPEEQP